MGKTKYFAFCGWGFEPSPVSYGPDPRNYSLHYRSNFKVCKHEFVHRYQAESVPKNRKITTRVSHSVQTVNLEEFKNRLIVTTLTGDLALLPLDTIDPVAESKMPRGKIDNVSILPYIFKLVSVLFFQTTLQPEMFASVHDGPIYNISRNPFVHNLFLTIGRQVLALWHEEHIRSPIFWRYSKAQLTDCKWSQDKPSVFFVTTEDGNFGAWDILSKYNCTLEVSFYNRISASLVDCFH